jgi:hypothetical protein
MTVLELHVVKRDFYRGQNDSHGCIVGICKYASRSAQVYHHTHLIDHCSLPSFICVSRVYRSMYLVKVVFFPKRWMVRRPVLEQMLKEMHFLK